MSLKNVWKTLLLVEKPRLLDPWGAEGRPLASRVVLTLKLCVQPFLCYCFKIQSVPFADFWKVKDEREKPPSFRHPSEVKFVLLKLSHALLSGLCLTKA